MEQPMSHPQSLHPPPNHLLDEDELDELDKIEEKWDVYNQHEASIKAQILTTTPESLAIEIQALDTGKKLCVMNTLILRW